MAEVAAAVPTPRAPAEPAPGRPESGRMVRIAGGTFQMGSNANEDNEKPVHAVRVGSFFMDVTEVTVGAYAACVRGGKCSEPDSDSSCNWKKTGRDKHPINCVDWNQATAYCGYTGKRLPTEEEWEYAARGSAGREYPWGKGVPSQQLCWNGSSTCEAGSFSAGATPEGVMDLAGNVWEWTSSPYCPYNSKNCSETARVDRGGGWNITYPVYVRGAGRDRYAPSDRFYALGFRCARAD